MLIVEDDKTLQSALAYNLVKEGYDARAAFDGAAGLELARREKPDLIILDIMLPGMSGLEVCRILRHESGMPVIMLTARDKEIDKIAGLDLGADDYITKPFSMRELLARVRARLRGKEGGGEAGQLGFGDVFIDLERHEVRRNNQPVELTTREFDLLAFLVRNKGIVFSREQLLEKVWARISAAARVPLTSTSAGCARKLRQTRKGRATWSPSAARAISWKNRGHVH